MSNTKRRPNAPGIVCPISWKEVRRAARKRYEPCMSLHGKWYGDVFHCCVRINDLALLGLEELSRELYDDIGESEFPGDVMMRRAAIDVTASVAESLGLQLLRTSAKTDPWRHVDMTGGTSVKMIGRRGMQTSQRLVDEARFHPTVAIELDANMIDLLKSELSDVCPVRQSGWVHSLTCKCRLCAPNHYVLSLWSGQPCLLSGAASLKMNHEEGREWLRRERELLAEFHKRRRDG